MYKKLACKIGILIWVQVPWQSLKEKYCLKKAILKWYCNDDFIADFDTDGDITLLKCKICRKYTAQLELRRDRIIYVAKFLIAFCRMLVV